jgi:hypothetical protein
MQKLVSSFKKFKSQKILDAIKTKEEKNTKDKRRKEV